MAQPSLWRKKKKHRRRSNRRKSRLKTSGILKSIINRLIESQQHPLQPSGAPSTVVTTTVPSRGDSFGYIPQYRDTPGGINIYNANGQPNRAAVAAAAEAAEMGMPAPAVGPVMQSTPSSARAAAAAQRHEKRSAEKKLGTPNQPTLRTVRDKSSSSSDAILPSGSEQFEIRSSPASAKEGQLEEVLAQLGTIRAIVEQGQKQPPGREPPHEPDPYMVAIAEKQAEQDERNREIMDGIADMRQLVVSLNANVATVKASADQQYTALDLTLKEKMGVLEKKAAEFEKAKGALMGLQAENKRLKELMGTLDTKTERVIAATAAATAAEELEKVKKEMLMVQELFNKELEKSTSQIEDVRSKQMDDVVQMMTQQYQELMDSLDTVSKAVRDSGNINPPPPAVTNTLDRVNTIAQELGVQIQEIHQSVDSVSQMQAAIKADLVALKSKSASSASASTSQYEKDLKSIREGLRDFSQLVNTNLKKIDQTMSTQQEALQSLDQTTKALQVQVQAVEEQRRQAEEQRAREEEERQRLARQTAEEARQAEDQKRKQQEEEELQKVIEEAARKRYEEQQRVEAQVVQPLAPVQEQEQEQEQPVQEQPAIATVATTAVPPPPEEKKKKKTAKIIRNPKLPIESPAREPKKKLPGVNIDSDFTRQPGWEQRLQRLVNTMIEKPDLRAEIVPLSAAFDALPSDEEKRKFAEALTQANAQVQQAARREQSTPQLRRGFVEYQEATAQLPKVPVTPVQPATFQAGTHGTPIQQPFKKGPSKPKRVGNRDLKPELQAVAERRKENAKVEAQSKRAATISSARLEEEEEEEEQQRALNPKALYIEPATVPEQGASVVATAAKTGSSGVRPSTMYGIIKPTPLQRGMVSTAPISAQDKVAREVAVAAKRLQDAEEEKARKVASGEEIAQEALAKKPSQPLIGKGKRRKMTSEGLSDTTLEALIRESGPKVSRVTKGVFSHDELQDLSLPTTAPSAMIVNTDPSTKSGRHWVSIYIDPRPEVAAVEYFDSLGNPPSSAMQQSITKMVKDNFKDLPHMLKYKVNGVKRQRANGANCGFFALKFVTDRIRGKSFSNATGFTKLNHEQSSQGERDVSKVKKRFGFI